MVVLLLTFFPLFFIGLLMKQNYLICGLSQRNCQQISNNGQRRLV